jgi:hypothetical protein
MLNHEHPLLGIIKDDLVISERLAQRVLALGKPRQSKTDPGFFFFSWC